MYDTSSDFSRAKIFHQKLSNQSKVMTATPGSSLFSDGAYPIATRRALSFEREFIFALSDQSERFWSNASHFVKETPTKKHDRIHKNQKQRAINNDESCVTFELQWTEALTKHFHLSFW